MLQVSSPDPNPDCHPVICADPGLAPVNPGSHVFRVSATMGRSRLADHDGYVGHPGSSRCRNSEVELGVRTLRLQPPPESETDDRALRGHPARAILRPGPATASFIGHAARG